MSKTSPGSYVDPELWQLVLDMTWNMVFKAIARNPRLFSASFSKEWGPLGPLPPQNMANLESLRTLHRLALADMI